MELYGGYVSVRGALVTVWRTIKLKGTVTREVFRGAGSARKKGRGGGRLGERRGGGGGKVGRGAVRGEEGTNGGRGKGGGDGEREAKG